MKKLAKNVPLCTAILIVVAILAIPLLGGFKLSTAYRSAEKRFEKALATPIEKNNTDIFSDSQDLINAAEILYDKGQQLGSDSVITPKYAKQLSEAIEECGAKTNAVERYKASVQLYFAARSYYVAFNNGEEKAALNKDAARVDAYYSTIKNTYRAESAEYDLTTKNLTTGFPAAQLANLFGIGGGK